MLLGATRVPPGSITTAPVRRTGRRRDHHTQGWALKARAIRSYVTRPPSAIWSRPAASRSGIRMLAGQKSCPTTAR